jgi:hypothetical protein
MFRRREDVPFAFVAEAERSRSEAEQFRSNVAPPTRLRPAVPEIAGRLLLGLVVAAAFAGSLLFGLPALEANPTLHQVQSSEASQHH